jgi:hypothetical protein
MGAKTKEVGGGSATPVANEFNNFLMQQMTGQKLPMINGKPATSFGSPAIQGGINQQQSNAQQPQQQSQTGFQNAYNNALSGNVNDISGAGGAVQNFFNDPTANNLSLPQFNNQYTSPDFQGANVSQLGTNFGQGQTGMANLGQFGNAAQSNFNPLQGMGQQAQSQFTGGLNNLMSQMGQGVQQGVAGQASISGPQSLGARPELGQGLSFEQAQGMANNMPFSEMMRSRAIADQRARFGAEGAGALGTGAQFAEGTMNADYAARTDQEGLNRALQLMGQDLNERSTGANVSLAGRGQDSQYNLGNRGMDAQLAGQNAQLQTQASMGNANNALQNSSNMLQGFLGARGQDFSNQAANRGMDVSQLGMGNQQSMFNAGQRNDMQAQMLNATLQNQGLGNAFGLNAATLNNNAQQTNNANSINQSQFQNNFNQNNAQNFANFGQANNSLNSQNQTNQQQVNNQMLQSMINSGMNLNQLGNQNTMAMLAQMFGAYGQSNALGTPQAQVVTQPSGFGQAANMGMQLFGSYLQGGGRIPGFGSGGGIPSLPGGGPPIGMTPGGNQNPYGGIGSYQPPAPTLPITKKG